MGNWVEDHANLLSGLAAILTVGSVVAPLLRRHKPAASATAPAAASPGNPPARDHHDDAIAVIPFDSLTPDPADAHVADGLSCELISALSRAGYRHIAPRSDSFALRGSALAVADIAKRLGVRFIVHGSVRHDGDRLRVIAELADARSGRLVWSKSYERPMARLLEVQDELAQAIAVSIGGEAFRALVLDLPPNTRDGSAWGLVQKARHDYLAGSGATVARACAGLVRQALRLDPHYALAHALLAQLLVDQIATGAVGPDGAERAEALVALDQAMALGQRDPEVLVLAGRAWHELGERGKAIVALQRATEIAPLDLPARGFLARAQSLGDPTEAKAAQAALAGLIASAPDHPARGSWELFSAIACLNLGQAEAARTHARRAVDAAPKLVRALMYQAASEATLGNRAGALQTLARARALDESFTTARFEDYIRRLAADRGDVVDRICGALRRLAEPAVSDA